MVEKNKCCGKTVEKQATIEKPYHFVDSGLPNVYLVGIKYWACKECGKQSAEIPALKDLLTKIARAVTQKEDLLTGQEIRFLRKRLGKKSADFARIIGVVPEQVSRWENDPSTSREKSADKLIRVFYSHLSGDSELKKQIDRHIEEFLSTIPGEEHTDRYRVKHKNATWTAEPIPA